MSDRIFKTVNVSSIIVPDEIDISRTEVHPEGKTDQNYVAAYDYKTLFYDVFAVPDGVAFVGPPLRNLKEFVESAEWRFDNENASRKIEIENFDRTTRGLTNIDSFRNELLFSNNVFSKKVQIQESFLDVFDGKNVLTTKNKNNKLQWIKDWAKFYCVHHNVNSILFYDNNSDEYSTDDILGELYSINELEIAIIVPLNFKFGPSGGPVLGKFGWGADFLEYSILEHAKLRFLRSANFVINADIDELMISANGQSIEEQVKGSKTGCISVKGIWIEAIVSKIPQFPRFKDFWFVAGNNFVQPLKCGDKWVADPKRIDLDVQWRTHQIAGSQPSDIIHRHFKGINTRWKYTDRDTIIEFASSMDCYEDSKLKNHSAIFMTGS